MKRPILRIQRQRRLTPAEGLKYDLIRQQIEQELPEILGRHYARMKGKSMDADLLFEGDQISVLKTSGVEFVSRDSEAAIVVATVDGEDQRKKIVLIEQFRPAINRILVELPSGKQKPGETAEDAAKRELLEETGYEAGEVYYLTQGPSSAGMSDEIITFILAPQVKKVGPGGGVGDEKIIVHEVDLITVNMWLEKHGQMIDPRIWAGIYARIAYLTARPQIDRMQ